MLSQPVWSLTLEIGAYGGYHLLALPVGVNSLVGNTLDSTGGINFWGKVGLQFSSNISLNVISGFLPVAEYSTTLAYKNSYKVRPFSVPIHADLGLHALGFFAHLGLGVNLYSVSYTPNNPEPGQVLTGPGAHLGVGYKIKLHDFIGIPIGVMGHVFMTGSSLLYLGVVFYGGVNFSI